MNDALCKEYVRLYQRKSALNAQLKGVEAELDQIEPLLITEFRNGRAARHTLDLGGAKPTISLHRREVPKMINGRAAVVEALRKAGKEEMIGVTRDLQTMVSHLADELELDLLHDNYGKDADECRELSPEDVRHALPEGLREELEIVFQYWLSCSKS